MRKSVTLLLLALTFAMASNDISAQEVTISLNHEWNWISCPQAEAVSISTFFGNFNPAENDKIMSHDGTFSEYHSAQGGWGGELQQLSPGVGYKYYSNRTETVSFVFNPTSSHATVTTHSLNNVTAVSAMVNTTVIVNGGSHVFARGVCWGTGQMPTVDDNYTSGQAVSGSLSITLENLAMSTTYYVRAYAVTEHGLEYGNVQSFVTMSGIPVVTTDAVPYSSANWALCHGMVTSDGGLEVTARGVCWSTSQNPTVNDNHTINGKGVGGFVSTITGLSANTTYYVRAYVINGNGTVYGNELNFTTLGSGSNNYAPTGAINGLFSVSNSQKVYFSQGNLQYQASTNTWRFATNQWDFVGTQTPTYGNAGGTVNGSDNIYVSQTYNGWIDLFGWGTSGFNHGANCYQPWSTSNNYSDYYAYGNSSYNLYDQTGQADWGYNPISNAGDQSDLWRTLTKDEWVYILNSRSASTVNGVTNARYVKAKVAGVQGVILFPDSYSHPTGVAQPTGINSTEDTGWSVNDYTQTDFALMQAQGAVFLPAAGHRFKTSVSYVGVEGHYWSASFSNAGNVLFLNFSNMQTNGTYRYNAHSVRLVFPE